jgi:aminopeptidase N
MSDIAYEKGRFFLTAIEEAVGRERWDAFLNKYFTSFAFKSMDTKSFLNYLEQELIKGDDALRNKINVDAWVYGPGLPSNCPKITSVELDKALVAAKAFVAGKPASQLNTKDFTTHHWLYFLRSMKDSLNLTRMTDLDKQFGFTQSTNAEIQCEWYQCAIATSYKEAYPYMERYMIAVGRRKFIKPLYAALSKTPENLKIARDIYAKARPGYHSVAVQTMDEMLK